METESQFLRKNQSDNADASDEERLIKDKLTPDLSFLNFIQYDKKEILNKSDADKAIREINKLKLELGKNKSLHKKWLEHLQEIFSGPNDKISAKEKEIFGKVIEYAQKNNSEIQMNTVDGKIKGYMELEHSKIEVIQIIKIIPLDKSKDAA